MPDLASSPGKPLYTKSPSKPASRSNFQFQPWPFLVVLIALILWLFLRTRPDPPGMARIPAGCFSMGAPESEPMSLPAERPVHQVCLNAFWMDRQEVTQTEFEQVMGYNPSHFHGCAQCPVEMVSWHEAQTFCQKTGKRLPTEAEWEYAARAGSQTTFPWGNLFDDTYAWAVSNSQGSTQPVRTCLPNAFGLHDMIGNVWEWTSDWADNQYYTHTPNKNPKGPASGSDKVIRGGAYNSKARNLRSATRGWMPPEQKQNYLGFRCAR